MPGGLVKAKCLRTKEVELKIGDKVTVYEAAEWRVGGTHEKGESFPRHFSTTSTAEGFGVVVRVYRHIGAVVVMFGRFGKKTQFIREGDPRFSIWRTS